MAYCASCSCPRVSILYQATTVVKVSHTALLVGTCTVDQTFIIYYRHKTTTLSNDHGLCRATIPSQCPAKQGQFSTDFVQSVLGSPDTTLRQKSRPMGTEFEVQVISGRILCLVFYPARCSRTCCMYTRREKSLSGGCLPVSSGSGRQRR